ncbi:Enoyl-CoA hydratase/isomerase [Catenulispora acidiphila DSM 44928]|uniref:Enoyl-CoA hydratase/isomerase n=1 Tax=Catenulispora acidiphila (strain DSM 44928 / JCM 14897 / NBRC 102108 / NRRL B-24433 / ID139908) TaxID=479433 RepID=C7Q5X6_CATAD|nr:enoyl-CoA hydratase-related protein [Catenulispora acidiphila]ACU70073.1 Enoyl-CoA hydratase/isomerase [Catenulispora acidiphila DSM 44928]
MTQSTDAPETTDAPELVLAERHGAVLLLTLNRPERLNAWNLALEERYFALLDEAEIDPEVRVVVVTGAGRGFCAGADMEDLSQLGTVDPDTLADERTRRPRERPLAFRKPLIAAINGPAAGLGLVQALYCDLRFATPEAKFTTAFARRGLIAEYGSAWLLPRLVGQSRALDLLMSARVVLGDEALAMGLVDRVLPGESLLSTTLAYAADLAENCSPASMALIKQQVYEAMDSDLPSAIEVSTRLMHESFRHPDAAEGVHSYLERRPPRFAPLDPA